MKKLSTLVVACLALSAFSAQALVIRVSQESVAGAGDFDANILGNITSYDTALTVSDFYQYNVPAGASYNGEGNGGPAAVSDTSQTFLVNGSDGLALVVVHDQPGDGDGGNTQTQWNLTGDTAAVLVDDDPGEATTVSAGGTQFNSSKRWVACCTDGYAIGDLNGNWAMFGQFLAAAGIDAWQATSADGADIALSMDNGRRARFDLVAVAEPSTIGLMSLGLIALGIARRRKVH